jgi:acetolactate synthase small subunit
MKIMSEEENKAVTRAIDEVMAENEMHKATIADLEVKYEEAKNLLSQANDFIANLKRKELIVEVKKAYSVGDEFIAEKSTDDLKRMVEMHKMAKPKIFKSSGTLASTVDEYDEALWKLNNKFKFDKKG